LENPSLRLLVAFFQNKGLEALKREDQREEWYPDWIDYQAQHGLYASLLSPQRYSSRGHRLDIGKLARFVETFGYFSPAHAYSLHVSLLGLFPILMSANEALKKEAIAKLEAGGLFAFAVSEKAHGSDLFANEFTVKPTAEPGESEAPPHAGWRADGAKHYIGNADTACLISVMAKKADPKSAGTSKRSPFVFFALRPQEAPAFGNVRKIRTLGVRTAFVGSFEVKDHVFPESDIICQGRSAWDAVRATINFGKFFLGFGAVGICEHALAEAVAHLRRRVLFGKPVTAMPHIRDALVFAFARLTAMKLYAYRALDYLQAASDSDRRYLLWSAVQKAKVSTEGVKVTGLLSECIGAKAFEADTYFEGALRDAQLIPSLEGSTHINFALTAQFTSPYFAGSGCDIPSPPSATLRAADAGENPYWLEGRDRIARTVGFAHFLKAYEPLRAVANVRSFVKQVEEFHAFAAGVSALDPRRDGAPAGKDADMSDAGLFIAMGKCLATIAYAQLIAENCVAAEVAPALVSVIFHGLIEDLSTEALKLSALFPTAGAQRAQLKGVVRIPETDAAHLHAVSELIAARYGR
jgi:acyl-CoA dehydrogenase